MIRTGSIIILILSVFFMIKGISETWKSGLASPPDVTKKQQEVTPEKAEPELTFNPVVPQVLPDLKSGYLFNAERLLAEVDKKDVELQTDMLASEEGVKTNIDDVTYSGALITDTFRWAIITYSAAPLSAKVDKKKRTSRRRRGRRPASKTTETTKVMEGDFVGGYKVASIESDRIIFSKAGETVEKYIYDPNKNRAKPPSRKVTAAKIPARPGVPSGVSNPFAASAPSSKLAAKRPRKMVATRRITTGRRLVVSRKPPARPNTSRVSRRRRPSGGAVGVPPVSGPPIPGHP